MAISLKIRRGNTSQNATFIGDEGELSYDTQKHLVRVHNGSKTGGYPVGGVMDVVEFRYIENGISDVLGGFYKLYSNGYQEYWFNVNRSATGSITFDRPFESADIYFSACCRPGSNGGPRFATITAVYKDHFEWNQADDSSWNNDGWVHFHVFGKKQQ
jgi:hypothetical protein